MRPRPAGSGRPARALVGGFGLLAGVVLAGCTAAEREAAEAPSSITPSADESRTASPTASGRPTAAPTTAEPSTAPSTAPADLREPARSFLSIPSIGVRDVPVVRYPGTTDDAAGTRIQDGGPAASPRGPRGGGGPGDVGNFLVTAHRTSHAAPFRDLPALEDGDRVRVRSGEHVFVYEITDTRRVSFRSAASLARQRAAVPGRPGATPVRPMITLSTCATAEDHAVGNYWSDRFGNPEHRIDKIGVLVDVRPA